MKILNRKQFLELPANTTFSRYSPCVFQGLEIKANDPQTWHNDFLVDDLIVPIHSTGSEDRYEKTLLAEKGFEIPLSFDDETGRDGLFEDEQLFAVYSKEDVKKLIKRLQECL